MPTLLSKAIILLLILLLAACGSDDSDDTGSSSNPPSGGGGTTTPEADLPNLAIGTGSGGTFQESQINAEPVNLSFGGASQLTFNVVDRGNTNALYTSGSVDIRISSSCLSNSQSELDGPLTFSTSSGEVSVRYGSLNCTGADMITARVLMNDTVLGEAFISLNIAPATAESMTIGVPDPQSLAPINAQTDSRPSMSQVRFTVLGARGVPVAGQQVNFSLSYGGGPALTEGAPRLEEASSTTNAQGQVFARVQAGKNNAVVRVVATLDQDSSISTTSEPIAINTLMPHQKGFSLSAEDFKPAAWGKDGVEVPITVRANDRLGNHAQGVIVNFVTSAGAIKGDCVLNEEGACTVSWVSQNPRQPNGYVTIMARTVGEESFVDSNGNGVFDNGEEFTETFGEPFLDVGWTRDFQAPTDTLFDKDGDGLWTGPSGQYVGSACPEGADYCRRGTKPVWSHLTGFWMASSVLSATLTKTPVPEGEVGENEYCVEAWGVITHEDENGEPTVTYRTPPPSGTTINFSTTGDVDIFGPLSSFGVLPGPSHRNTHIQCVQVEIEPDEDAEDELEGTLEVLVGDIVWKRIRITESDLVELE